MAEYMVFFRNDDVAMIEPGLKELTELFLERHLPITHAVEPANLTPETARWLLTVAPHGVEIIQHGYSHARHDKGEFGGNRSYANQLQDVSRGKRIMEDAFGSSFFPAFSFPYGAYNRHSMPVLAETSFKVVSSHVKFSTRRVTFDRLGRLLHRNVLWERGVSYHCRRRPQGRLWDLSVCLSPIKQYLGGRGSSDCTLAQVEELKKEFMFCSQHTRAIGVVLHHRYHHSCEHSDLLTQFIDWLVSFPRVRVVALRQIWTALEQLDAAGYPNTNEEDEQPKN